MHEVVGRTRKSKDSTNVINHHGLVKLIVDRDLNHTQIMWGDLIELDIPLKIEQPEVHHEIPPQGIEAAQTEGDNSQIEIPTPNLKLK